MAISFSRPDPSSPTAVAGATFPSARRGFDQNEVRDFLRMVSAELSRLQERVVFLERELANVQHGAPMAPLELDEDAVAAMLGEETLRIVQTAREAAAKIKTRADETATRLIREATDEAARIREDAELEGARRRQDASSDAESEILMAKQQGRDMVNEARAYRERVLADVAKRRELAREQLEDLMHSRDRLIQAFERARVATDDVLRDLDEASDETNEFVNLANTTGPVPIIVQVDELPAAEAATTIAPVPYDQDDDPVVDAPVVNTVVDHPAPIDITVIDETPVVEDTVADEEVTTTSNVVSLFPRSDQRTMSVADMADDDLDDDADDESDPPMQAPIVVPSNVTSRPKPAPVDDLFAKLRRAGADTVAAKEAAKVEAASVVAADETKPTGRPNSPVKPIEAPVIDHPVTDSAADEQPEATVFQTRDEVLAPIIATMSRKAKRVLADEQNQVLDTLRGKKPVKTLDAIVGPKSDHAARYTGALEAAVKSAALAGARSLSDASDKELAKDIAKQMAAVNEQIVSSIVAPLRERLSRSISQAAGDNTELASLVRLVYREWKNQHIDTHVDDIGHAAHGRGALAALDPGAKVCWKVDPNGPACADAEDNSLAGAVRAGDAFPTGHTHAPAHSGCRCALVPHQN
ncbi:MAG: DivIVA domain-containing protein [Ilumatobacteraceae bacterium]|nr:DivIVA domain-containing protein [Ilumatobacteraceae bacterium]